MDICDLPQLISMNPFSIMNKIIIDEAENCILGNRCFIKFSSVSNLPAYCIDVNDRIFIRNIGFSLEELIYSPFHYKHLQYQYLMPEFIFKCIDRAKQQNMKCYYCYKKQQDTNYLMIDIFIPTKRIKYYLIIGLRIKEFWCPAFKFTNI